MNMSTLRLLVKKFLLGNSIFHLQSECNIISVVIAKIIAIVNTNMSTIILLVKKFLLGDSIFHLQSKCNIISVVIAKIIAIVNTNMSTIILLVKKFLLGDSISISCLSFKSKFLSSVYTLKYIL